MSREKRTISQTGMYHIICKGVGGQNIFEGPVDYEKLKQTIAKVKQELEFDVFAYCFMSNHFHLFLKEKNAVDISKIMSKILSSYALWFNLKYKRSGALFGNRYKSEPVEDDRYFLSLIKYIHQNPVKAKMVSKIADYPYSSYREYVKGTPTITDIDFFLNGLNDDRKKATKEFIDLHDTDEDETYEITESKRKSPAYLRRIIMNEINGKEPHTIKQMQKDIRNDIIKKLVNEVGLSKSELARAIGISRHTIISICNQTFKKHDSSQALPFFLD